MVRASLYMKVKAGRGEDFERVWRQIADEVWKAPGNAREALTRDPDDPDGFAVTSDWDRWGTFSEAERSPAEDDLTAPPRVLREWASRAPTSCSARRRAGRRFSRGRTLPFTPRSETR